MRDSHLLARPEPSCAVTASRFALAAIGYAGLSCVTFGHGETRLRAYSCPRNCSAAALSAGTQRFIAALAVIDEIAMETPIAPTN